MRNGRTIWIRVLTFGGFIGWLVGANIAGFVKVADAMLDQGVV